MPEIGLETPEVEAGREQAFRILRRVESSGAYASILLERLPAGELDPREIRLVTELVYGTLRWRARIDHFLAGVSDRRLERLDPPIRTALRLAAYQILFLDRIPRAAAVNASVNLARRGGGESGARFANGLLRNLCRRIGEIPLPPGDSPSPAHLEVIFSHPSWIIRRWVRRFGLAGARTLLEADNRVAPLVLRVQTPRVDPARLAGALRSEGVETKPSPILPEAVRVFAGNPFRTRPFSRGWFYAQDEASQIVPMLFGEPETGMVLDLCAAPGGKAIQIASRDPRGICVIAGDRNKGRLRRLRGNQERLGVGNLLLLGADFRRASPLRARFPRVLLDAPCSGTGTLRRNPEIRWRLRPADLPRLVKLQRELLETAAGHLAPGGALVYSVCSLEAEEGPDQIRRFLDSHPEFRLRDARRILPERIVPVGTEGPFLATRPDREGLDGFFAARVDRAGS